MISKGEVIEIADACNFDIVKADKYCAEDNIADSGNRWITEKMQRFANACYKRGIEDAAKLFDGCFYSLVSDRIRELGETE